jgi:hypothetical protein
MERHLNLIENFLCRSFFMKHVSAYGSYHIMSPQLNIWLLQGPFQD